MTTTSAGIVTERNSRNGVPATTSTPQTISTIAMVVPRSGSILTSAQTTSTTAPSGLISSISVCGGRRRAASTAAANSSIAALANSDGWIEIGPSSSQRRALLISAPMPGTSTSTNSSTTTPSTGTAM